MREDVTMEAEVRVMQLLEEKGMSQRMQTVSRYRKRKETESPLKPLERMLSCQRLDCSPVKLIWGFGLPEL